MLNVVPVVRIWPTLLGYAALRAILWCFFGKMFSRVGSDLFFSLWLQIQHFLLTDNNTCFQGSAIYCSCRALPLNFKTQTGPSFFQPTVLFQYYRSRDLRQGRGLQNSATVQKQIQTPVESRSEGGQCIIGVAFPVSFQHKEIPNFLSLSLLPCWSDPCHTSLFNVSTPLAWFSRHLTLVYRLPQLAERRYGEGKAF